LATSKRHTRAHLKCINFILVIHYSHFPDKILSTHIHTLIRTRHSTEEMEWMSVYFWHLKTIQKWKIYMHVVLRIEEHEHKNILTAVVSSFSSDPIIIPSWNVLWWELVLLSIYAQSWCEGERKWGGNGKMHNNCTNEGSSLFVLCLTITIIVKEMYFCQKTPKRDRNVE
jgi:hypothetical protein